MSHPDLIEQMLEGFFETRYIDPSAGAMLMWIDALSDLSLDEIRQGIRRANREKPGPINPAELRQFCEPEKASNEDRAVLAWQAVRRATGRFGGYSNVKFDDPCVTAAVRATFGSWNNLCEQETESVNMRQRDFIKAYETVARTGVGDATPLMGIGATKRIEMASTGLPEHPMAMRLASLQPEALPAMIPLPAMRRVEQ